MNRRACAAVAVLLLAGACGGSETPEAEPTKDATPSPAASEPATEELVAAPGAIGPVLVGMTIDEAKATGLFEPRKVADDDPCKDAYGPIQWKAPHTKNLMVGVWKDGKKSDEITVLGITGSVKTAKGVGVGSTLADVTAAYPDAKVEESVALGSTIYRRVGEKWLGMGFNETPDEIKDGSKVLFMEITVGEKPAAFLSGCNY